MRDSLLPRLPEMCVHEMSRSPSSQASTRTKKAASDHYRHENNFLCYDSLRLQVNGGTGKRSFGLLVDLYLLWKALGNGVFLLFFFFATPLPSCSEKERFAYGVSFFFHSLFRGLWVNFSIRERIVSPFLFFANETMGKALGGFCVFETLALPDSPFLFPSLSRIWGQVSLWRLFLDNEGFFDIWV